MNAHETAVGKTDKIPGPQPSPSSAGDRWRRAKMTLSDGKNYSQGWAISQSAWCERAKADGESRVSTQRRSMCSSLNHGKEPDTWKLGRENSQAKATARTKNSRLEEKERRAVLPTWALFRVEVWEDTWWELGVARLDLLMWLYAMRFSLLLTWLQELLTQLRLWCMSFTTINRDSWFNNLLIFSIPCVFILSLQQHIF